VHYRPVSDQIRSCRSRPKPTIRDLNVAGHFLVIRSSFPQASLGASMDIAAWLEGLGLGQYQTTFRENRLDADVLPELTDADLNQLGIPLGDRKRLLRAIASLGSKETVTEPLNPRRMPSSTDTAERRQLTVMFCDLVGSTAMSARLDPEDMREIIRAYQDACSGAVARYDGFVGKFMGDGVLAYFGFPRAHEEDAERAVRAGLDISDVVTKLETSAKEKLMVRIGIATGVVVVGDLVGEGSAQEQAVVGETPNLAARLQAAAEPGDIVIADSTRRLLGGVFELKLLGPQSLKGFDAPVPVWTVVREAENVSRFEASRSQEMTPFVGREHETALLIDRWRDASEGEGHVALLSGEAGIGKSRILAALRERICDEPHVTIRYQCSPHHLNDAFYPIAGQIRHAAGFVSGEPPAARREKLEAMINRTKLDPRVIAPLLAALLSIPTEGQYAPLEMAPSEQKERTIAALIALFAALAKNAPVLALLEDAHWIDPTSLDVIGRLVDRIPDLRALLVITFRSEFAAPWVGRAHVELLPLSRFGRRQAMAMIDRLTEGKALPPEVLDQIISKTDGIPLFLEELTKTVLESGLLRKQDGVYVLRSALTPLAIPSTLQDSLMARLDHLATVKETAQIGAAIGREFSYRLLEAVSPTKGPALQDALNQLMGAQLIYRREMPPEATYIFKHALVQDTAYATLLKSRRQQLHQRIAEILRDNFPERAELEPGVIAHHFTQAGLLEMAVEWWGRAGRRAMNRFANFEAMQSLEHALTLIAKMPKNEELDRREVSFRLAFGPALLATRGYASVEVERNYEAANLLSNSLGDREALFASARGLWNCFYDRADLDRGLVLAERLLDLAKEDGSLEKQALALRALGSTRMSRAEFTQSAETLDTCIEVSARLPLGACFARHGEEPQIVATQYKGFIQCICGFADRGLESVRLAVTLAKKINHPLSLAFTSDILSIALLFRREFRECATLANEQIEYCREHGFVFWLAAVQIYHGAALAHLQADGDGALQAKKGLVNWINTGAILHVPTWSSIIAEAALVSGKIALAEEMLSSGIQTARRNGEFLALADLQRLTGRLLLIHNRRDDARGAFADAIMTARQQGARLYLLRAARDCAQLLVEDDDPIAARELLQPIIDDYPEHRNGRDFQEAAELLLGLK
jgi:class 3 adenylate cyclase